MFKKIFHLVKNGLKRLCDAIYHRIYISSKLEKNIVDQFHTLYYYSSHNTWGNTYWLGVPALKCPLDLWIYQEIISEVKPDIIIETGTVKGRRLILSFFMRFIESWKNYNYRY